MVGIRATGRQKQQAPEYLIAQPMSFAYDDQVDYCDKVG